MTCDVPLELVQRVTGHRTAAVVRKLCFRPGREDFRQVLFKAMPKRLTDGGRKLPKEEMRAIGDRTSARAGKRGSTRLLELPGNAAPRFKSQYGRNPD